MAARRPQHYLGRWEIVPHDKAQSCDAATNKVGRSPSYVSPSRGREERGALNDLNDWNRLNPRNSVEQLRHLCQSGNDQPMIAGEDSYALRTLLPTIYSGTR
jgi:hypothetical protein